MRVFSAVPLAPRRLGWTAAMTVVALAAVWVAAPNASPDAPVVSSSAADIPVVLTAAPSSSAERTEAGTPLGSGEASYYGDELAGHPTAGGERFDPDGFTAAHRTLPMGSRLRVTHAASGRSVIVRVNDRGPFAKDRVVDVSERAARDLGMLRTGTAHVTLELLPSRRV
ncbi:MAG: septal ring lytic transglycosylase RlpA family protein [Bacteroidota bacterium]